MKPIVIDPRRLTHFGPPESSSFCLVTSVDCRDWFVLKPHPGYRECVVEHIGREEDFARTLGRLPAPAHVLVILPDRYFQSPPRETLGPHRKLSVMACGSTPSDADTIRHFVAVAEGTSPEDLDAMAEDFFTRGGDAKQLRFLDSAYGTELVFDHLGDDYGWHEQVGALDWGEQQILPAGEVSVLPTALYESGMRGALRLDGTIALRGLPIVHSGTPSFLPSDRQRIFEQLSVLGEAPLIATVRSGAIVALRADHPQARPALDILEALFAVDSRYRTIIEVGFSMNLGFAPYPGNSAMNEVCGFEKGSVHWGMGLIPYTQYHLDVLTPATEVTNEKGEVLLGGRRRARMLRNRSALCPCMESRRS